MTKYNFTQEQKDQVKQLFDTGLSAKQISEQLSYRYHHVLRILKEFDVDINRDRFFTDEKKQEIIDMYKQGKSGLEIAKELKHGKNHVYRILKESGVVIEDYRNKFSPEVELEICNKYKEGASLNRLAEEYDSQAATISYILDRHGVEKRPVGKTSRKLSTDQIALVAKEWAEGKSQKEIATSLEMDQRTLSTIMKLNGISFDTRKGELHSRWKGGKRIHSGYVYVNIPPDDPYVSMANGSSYVFEHRYVMAKHLGRVLSDTETVHHINGDTQDNRIENLQLRQGKHGNGVCYKCSKCGSVDVIAVEIDG
jgi:DNA invertase Pin-like site-specific DNA recombinase